MNANRAWLATMQGSSSSAFDLQVWDTNVARQFRYAYFQEYYNGTAFENINSYAGALKLTNHSYKWIRTIYSPITRDVDLYVAYVYGGNLDMENGERGAIPIADADDRLRQAIIQGWKWSKWGTNKQLYVRQGGIRGDTFIKVVDDTVKSRVRMQVLDPADAKEVDFDDVGNITRIVIEYQRREKEYDATSKLCTYREEIDREWFKTFKDGQPFAWYADVEGNGLTQWPNEYGFVPVGHSPHKQITTRFGAPPFYGSLGKVNEINDAASILNDSVRLATRPMYFGAGFNKQTALDMNDDNRDSIPLITTTSIDAKLTPLNPATNVADGLANLQSMLNELERDMPELALYKVRDGGNLTAPGVQAAYGDAIARINEARGNYDDCLVRAQMMMVSIGGFRGYEGFRGYNLDSYDKGDLAHSIAERPVIADKLTMTEKVAALQAVGNAERQILEMLDFSEATIDEIMAAKEMQKAQAVAQFAQGLQVGRPAVPQLPSGMPKDMTNNAQSDPNANPGATDPGTSGY